MSTIVQGNLYTYLLRRADEYSIDLQEVGETNLRLKDAGMAGKLNQFSKEQIAEALDVDAIVGGSFEIEQTQSDAVALTSMVLLGGIGGRTGTRSLTLTIYGMNGEALWRFYKSMDDRIFTPSAVDTTPRMMRKVSRNFPYRRKVSN